MASQGEIFPVLVAVVLAAIICPTFTDAGVSDYIKSSKLFNYDSYRETFSKRVRPGLEYMSRQRLYLSRALRAYLSGVQYKFWKREDYKAVNHMSDYSPEEIALMKNKEAKFADFQLELTKKQRLRRQQEGEAASRLSDELALPELLPDQEEDVEQELVELIRKHGDEPGYADLREHIEDNSSVEGQSGQSRRRRSIETLEDDDVRVVPVAPREMPRLINTGEGEGEVEIEHKPVSHNLRSNNRNYEPVELFSEGLIDQQVDIKLSKVQPKDGRPVGQQLSSSLEAIKRQAGAPAAPKKSTKPDQVFVDHRTSKCFLPPRHQELCGSCYAFATTALMEYLLCKKTGQLTALSEQYMIDCGKGRVADKINNEELKGCQGGRPLAAAKFVHNFGVETLAEYPFLGREGRCRYPDNYNLAKTGKYRFNNVGVVVSVSMEFWAKYLKSTPMYVNAKTGTGFEEWANGLDMGSECSVESNHAMVLIGHGRQNGYEYWLLRNSYGDKWGDKGYWKLYRGATRRCLSQYAYIYGTMDGINL